MYNLPCNWSEVKNCGIPISRLYLEAAARRCSVKKVFLEILQNSQENTCARVSFLIKLQASGRPQAYNFIENKTMTQVFSWEFCKICKNIFVHETPLVAASKPKVHKSNGLLKQRICFHRFYFNLFFTSKYLLSGHNSKKQQHIFFF